jgi:hypothetical protein
MSLRKMFLVSQDFLNKNEQQSLPNPEAKKPKKRINKMKHVKKKNKSK